MDEFVTACSHGDRREAERILANINSGDDVEATKCSGIWKSLAFMKACRYGHLEVAMWLLRLQGFNPHEDEDYAHRWAVANGHVHVSQWLRKLGGVDIHARNDWAIRAAVDNGQLVSARNLLSTSDSSWPEHIIELFSLES